MGRLLLAGVLVASAVGIAGADTRKVKVETTPPGATVYIDSVENGAACDATPCTIDVPVGSPTLIVQLAKYQPEFKQLDVGKGKKPLSVSMTLKEATGFIVIDSPKGASVKINGNDEGKVPVRAKVPAEPVRVLVTMGGKTLYDDFVEVEAGGEQEVTVKGGGATAKGGGGTTVANKNDEEEEEEEEGDEGGSSDGSGSGEGSGSGDDSGGSVDEGAEVTRAPPAPYLQVGIAFDVGFRRFAFSDGSSPFANSGEALLGPALELWPGRMAGVHILRNMSLFARIQFALKHQKVTRDNMGVPEDVGAETFWGGLEVSLRQKWIFGDVLGVEGSAGYVRDQVEFSAINETTLMQVPSADYRSIRIGARISIEKSIAPYVSIENRVVLSGGDLANRADTAKTSGFAAAAGVNAKLGPLGVRAEGSYAQYSWTYGTTSATPPPADGASDKLFGVMLVVGYQY